MIEMRDRVGDIDAGTSGGGTQVVQQPDIAEEAESALIALGYKPRMRLKWLVERPVMILAARNS